MKNGFIKVAAVTPSMRVADLSYNVNEMISLTKEVANKGVSLAVFPELSISGYTCGDLFLTRTMADKALEALEKFIDGTADTDTVAVVGLPFLHGGKLYNCAAVCKSGELLGIVPKTHIPEHGEFSEARYFVKAPDEGKYITVIGRSVWFGSDIIFRSEEIPGFAFGVEICEDLWVSDAPSSKLCAAGAYIICNPAASNETVGKDAYRRNLISVQSSRCICGYIFSSCGTDESTTDLVFSGHDIIAENGSMLAERLPFAGEKYCITEIDVDKLMHDRTRTTTFNGNYDEVIEKDFSHNVKETELTRKIERFPFIASDDAERTRRAETILSIQASGLAKRLTAAYAKTAVIGISGGLDSTLALIVACRAMDMLKRPRTDIIGITMPCFGTTKRTKGNAQKLCEALGITFRTVNITKSVRQHFADIGHDEGDHNVVYENSQARERTQVIMDISNETGGLVVGTGDLSELALGWATYNGDHMSMYGVNADVPKTLVRHVVRHYADKMKAEGSKKLSDVLYDILDTPVSPELLPANADGTIAQVTEDLVGPYELHDFYIYNFVRYGFSPKKLLLLAEKAFEGVYDKETLLKWLKKFIWRFFSQQFKRSCVPDGPKVGSVGLSPRGDWKMPSDAVASMWIAELDEI